MQKPNKIRAIAAAACGLVLILGSCGKKKEHHRHPEVNTEKAKLSLAPSGTCDMKIERRIRRLTDRQYHNAVRDLLGLDSLRLDEEPSSFYETASSGIVTPAKTHKFAKLASVVSANPDLNIDEIFSCSGSIPETTCVKNFVSSFASRAFRRPVTEAEQKQLTEALLHLASIKGRTEAFRATLETIFQSPSFVYRTEVNAADSELLPYEIASFLSFFFLDSIPDVELWRAAVDGDLTTDNEIRIQIERLLALPAVKMRLSNLFVKWLGIEGLAEAKKFPDSRDFAAVRNFLLEETKLFLYEGFQNPESQYGEIFTSNNSFINKELRNFYGLPVSLGPGFEKVEFPADQRQGILTQAGLLASLAETSETSPVRRGLFVLEKFLCVDLPSPPDNIVQMRVGTQGEQIGQKELALQRGDNDACRGCHNQIDPIGLAFESFDQFGSLRSGFVEFQGKISSGSDIDGEFTSLPDFASKLAASPQVAKCIAQQFHAHILGVTRRSLTEQCVSDPGPYAKFQKEQNLSDLIGELVFTTAVKLRSKL